MISITVRKRGGYLAAISPNGGFITSMGKPFKGYQSIEALWADLCPAIKQAEANSNFLHRRPPNACISYAHCSSSGECLRRPRCDDPPRSL